MGGWEKEGIRRCAKAHNRVGDREAMEVHMHLKREDGVLMHRERKNE